MGNGTSSTSLTQARKRVEPITSSVEIEPDNELVGGDAPRPTSLLSNTNGQGDSEKGSQ